MKPVSNFEQYGYGYKFGVKTYYSNFHLGLDILCPVGTPLYAPFSGNAVKNPFADGGNVIDFHTVVDGQSYVMRFMHLSEYVKLGQVNEGELIAKTGNTGNLSTGAHLHLDISRNAVNINNLTNFVDPLTFNWEDSMSQSDIAELNYLREQRSLSVKNKQNEYRRKDEATVRCIIEAPSPDWFVNYMGCSFDNVREIPVDWPLDPKDWENERLKLQPVVDQLNADLSSEKDQLAEVKKQLDIANLSLENTKQVIDGLTGQIDGFTLHTKDLSDQLGVALTAKDQAENLVKYLQAELEKAKNVVIPVPAQVPVYETTSSSGLFGILSRIIKALRK